MLEGWRNFVAQYFLEKEIESEKYWEGQCHSTGALGQL